MPVKSSEGSFARKAAIDQLHFKSTAVLKSPVHLHDLLITS